MPEQGQGLMISRHAAATGILHVRHQSRARSCMGVGKICRQAPLICHSLLDTCMQLANTRGKHKACITCIGLAAWQLLGGLLRLAPQRSCVHPATIDSCAERQRV